EDDATDELLTHHELAQLAQHLLAGLIRRMRLAGEQQHHGALGIVDEASEARAIAQQQGGALVGGETPRKAEREHVGSLRIEQPRDVPQLWGTPSFARELAMQTLAHIRQHARFHVPCRRPVALVRDLLESAPEVRIAQSLAPLPAELAIKELHPALMEKG